MKAKKWVLVRHFQGEPKDDDLELQEEDLPDLKDGDFLTEAVYLSVDPFMRPYVARFPAGITMIGQQLARVTESKNADYPVGCHLLLLAGWRTHTVVDPSKVQHTPGTLPYIQRIPDLGDLSLSLTLGAVGMPGMTANLGFLELCKPKEGEVVLVNGAAGAVGSLVGQIAKIKGCRVIGYAGTDEKVAWLKEIGFDYAFNYKTCDLNKTLKEAAPEGVDCYFDNVGGEFSDTVLTQHMKLFGRVAICGSISGYNSESGSRQGPELYYHILGKQLTINGFLIPRFYSQFKDAQPQMINWIKEGKIKTREHVTEGFANMRSAFYGMLKGENTGKAVVKI